MKLAIVNGVRLTILTKAEAEQHRIKDECLDAGYGLLIYGLKSIGDVVKASGLEYRGEVDYAVDVRTPIGHSKDARFYVTHYPNTGEEYQIDTRTLIPSIVEYALAQAVEAA
jgi:hypothetical protein